MIIIGITGTLGSGKGEVSNYLVKKYGFDHFSFSEYFKMELQMRGRDINRDEMVKIANELRSELGDDYLRQILSEVYSNKTNCVVESIRTRSEIDWLLQQEGTYVFSVDAPIDLRYKRITQRNSEKDSISFEKFKEQEALEMKNTDPNKQNLSYCMNLIQRPFRFLNETNIESLYTQIDLAMNLIDQHNRV